MNKKTRDYKLALSALREAEALGEYGKKHQRLVHRLKTRVADAARALSTEERAELGLDDNEAVQS